jgi:hypothetical protein
MKLKEYLTEKTATKSVMEILLKAALDKRLDDGGFRALAVKHLRRLI